VVRWTPQTQGPENSSAVPLCLMAQHWRPGRRSAHFHYRERFHEWPQSAVSLQDVLVTLGCGFIVAAICRWWGRVKGDFRDPQDPFLEASAQFWPDSVQLSCLVFTDLSVFVLQTLVQSQSTLGVPIRIPLPHFLGVSKMAGGFNKRGSPRTETRKVPGRESTQHK